MTASESVQGILVVDPEVADCSRRLATAVTGEVARISRWATFGSSTQTTTELVEITADGPSGSGSAADQWHQPRE